MHARLGDDRLPRGVPTGEPEPPGGVAPWLEERLFKQRIVLVQGRLSVEQASRAAAILLSFEGDEPIELHMSTPDGDLAGMFALADALAMTTAPVRAVARAEVGGAAVGVFASTGRRMAFPHARFRLAEPKAGQLAGTADQVVKAAGEYLRGVEQLVLCVAEACGKPRSRVEDDFQAGRMLNAQEALEYGLVDEILNPPRGGGRA